MRIALSWTCYKMFPSRQRQLAMPKIDLSGSLCKKIQRLREFTFLKTNLKIASEVLFAKTIC